MPDLNKSIDVLDDSSSGSSEGSLPTPFKKSKVGDDNSFSDVEHEASAKEGNNLSIKKNPIGSEKKLLSLVSSELHVSLNKI